MRRLRIEWDEDTVDHIARHGVEPEEVEELLTRRHLWHRGRAGRYEALGRSAAGRYLMAVLAPHGANVYRVVTARDMTDSERKRFRRRTT
jgi:uncharacterized DUF497 family protein